MATWYDESVSHVCGKLEHGATLYPEFQADKIISLHTCVLFTAVRLESGAIYWWGVLPFNQRKRLLEKYTNKKKSSSKQHQRKSKSGSSMKNSSSGSNASNEIAVGSQVCMKKAPMYHPGSIGFTVAGGIPKVGQLLNAAWNITDECRFKLIQPPKKPKIPELPREKDKQKEEYDSASMPPPPSPASSTCSDGSMNMSSRRQKRSAPKEEPEKNDEEEWNLKDVIFVEDSRNMPIGRVIKVDGQHTVVHFPIAGEKTPPVPAPPAAPSTPTAPIAPAPPTPAAPTTPSNAPTPPPPGAPPVLAATPTKKEGPSEETTSSLLMSPSTRILPRDQLQLIEGGSLPRVPDCFQRVPKKVSLQNTVNDMNMSILAIMVDGQGVHAIVKNDNGKLSHRIYNLSSGKIEVDSKFPTDSGAFCGLNPQANVSFVSTGESEFVSVLMDGNRTIYPLVKDSTPSADSIKDPQLLDLPPVQALGLGTHALPHVGSGKKNEVAVIVLSFVSQLVIPKILQCDLEAVKRIIAGLEADPTSIQTQELIQTIIDERADGGRNIFHVAVSMCQPTSNKDSDQDVYSGSNSGSTFASSFDIEPSLTSGAMNLREIMRRATAATQR